MRKKKNPRLPNGYGSIRKMSGNRRNPYGVYPPQLEEDQDGRRLPVKAICYVPTWTIAFAVLTAYNAGTYTPGMENSLISAPDASADVTGGILADYARIRRTLLNEPEETPAPTFAEVYEAYYKDKFETGKSYSGSMQTSTKTAYKNCSALHDRVFKDLRLDDLQAVVDSCPLKHSSLELIVLLIKQMYRYAEAHELCDRNYGQFVQIRAEEDDEHGVPFSEEELLTLWQHSDDPAIEMVLIMCYAGYRISAYKNMTVNLEGRYFEGGNKTDSGKNLIMPIHSATFPLVERRLRRDGRMISRVDSFRKSMYEALERCGIQRHTPHDCKHTFSALCEHFGVNENDRKRMLGHKVGNITNDVYGHRTLEELRAEIEKIKAPEVC